MGINQRSRSKFAHAALLALGVGAACTSHAQIMLKASGQGMQPLRQKSIDAEVKISGQFATTKITHIFENPMYERVEAEFVYVLPKGATVTSFAYWYGDEKVPAYVAEKERAREIYKSITTRQRDPALVELVGKNSFRAKIFPVMPKADLRVEVTYVSVLTTDNGVPTFSLPIAMKKGEPLESLKAQVEIDKEDWMQSIFNSRGKIVSEDGHKAVIEVDEKNVRPVENFRIGFKPKSPVVSCFSGRASGKDGYFILTVPSSSKPQITAPGVKIFSLHTSRLGPLTVVTGKYQGSGSGTVSFGKNKASITFSDEAKGAHIAVKKWAFDEIERLTGQGSAKQVINLSMLHGMPSKYTAWIAIPKEERSRHQRLIDEAQAKVYAKKYVDLVFRQSGETVEAKRLHKQFEVAAKKLDMSPRDVIYALSEEKLGEFAESIRTRAERSHVSASERQKIHQEVRRFKSVAKAFNVNFVDALDGYFQSTYRESANRIARHEMGLDTRNSNKEIADDKRRVKNYSEMLGISQDEIMNPQFAQCLREISQQTLDDLYEGKIEKAKAFEKAKRVKSQLAKRKIDEIAFDASTTTYGQIIQNTLAKENLKEQVSQKDLSKAYDWMDAAEAFKGVKREVFLRISVDNYLLNDSYQAQESYLKEAEKSSYTSKEAEKWLDRMARNRNLTKGYKSEIDQIIKASTSRVGYNLAEEAFRGKATRDSSKRQVEPVASLFTAKFPFVKFDKDSSVRETFEQGIRDRLHTSAYYYLDAKSQLRLDHHEIQEDQARFEDYAKWAGIDSKQILRDVLSGYGDEWALRYELYQQYLSDNPDRERIRQLESKFMDATKNWKGEAYVKDRMARLKVNADINNVIDEIGENANSPQKAELEKKRDELIAKEKIIAARMGDPILGAKLPSSSTEVSATFPWGEKRPMIWNAKTKQFECHFDIPPTAVEGLQPVKVDGKAKDGTTISVKDQIHVDVTAPKVNVQISEHKIVLDDLSGDVARVKVFVNDRPAISMSKGAESKWWTGLSISPNDEVRVVATDKAHNRTEYPTKPAVQPKTAPIVTVPDAQSELSGLNVQSMAQLGDLIFAGTLEEGLWVRDAKGLWSELKNLPSRCPRTMVRLGDRLIVRFSDGSLIELGSDLKWNLLTSKLPRREALAIATQGSKLFVAQPGGYSEFDGKEWTHHFGIKLLTGAAISTITASERELWVGVQGLGIVVVDLSSGEAKLIDERSGLTDDWVTQIALTTNGVTVGTFVGGALDKADQGFNCLTETAGSCVTAISADGELIGTRTGLFSRKDGAIHKVVSKGLPEEIQSLLPTENGLWIGTRNGVRLIPNWSAK